MGEQEKKRLLAALSLLPEEKRSAGYILELGGGYGRNQPLLRGFFPEAVIHMVDQSQANIDIATSEMKIPAEDCCCAAIQDLAWVKVASSVDVIVDWWTLSYLEDGDLRRVLFYISNALKPDGVFLLCLPVRRNGKGPEHPHDPYMHFRDEAEYEALFQRAGLITHPCKREPRHYLPAGPRKKFHQEKETLWILMPKH